MPEIESLDVSAFTIPTSSPEADGTPSIVVVEVTVDGVRGLAYTFADASTAHLIERLTIAPLPAVLNCGSA